MNANARITLFTHTDFDGAACEVVARCAYGSRVEEVRYVDYNNVDQETRNWLLGQKEEESPQIVFFTDICPSQELVKEIVGAVEDGEFEACIIDHHKTTAWLQEYTEFPWIVQDQAACGAKLFSMWLRNVVDIALDNEPLDGFIALADVYDRWQKESSDYPAGARLHRLVGFLGFEEFVKLHVEFPLAGLATRFDYIAERLAAKEARQLEAILDEHVIGAEFFHDKKRRCYAMLNVTAYASQIGNAILEHDVGVDYVVMLNPMYNKVDLRSRKGGVDVAAIAKGFGGGGHQPAAGFQYAFGTVLPTMFAPLF